jgi:FtsZ-binding cell division protein ZapB
VAKITIQRSEQTSALFEHIAERLKEHRNDLEDERNNAKPENTVALRARINELKDLLDRFGLPGA